ncbi:hypothetical protein B0A48_09047 [Cryoendolithus antarcticus]|uniref:DUF1279 domain-containing protein n=1 Tax=Cryoendolithus antarcticus TaxID=1507870 RepID=A0A1V8T1S5_9PEZI|nr:hypothetical protein B0A48_09047 [Cryoendolithus antarcticus]
MLTSRLGAHALQSKPLQNHILRTTFQRTAFRAPPRSRSGFTIRPYTKHSPPRSNTSLLWQLFPRDRIANRFRSIRNSSTQSPHSPSPAPAIQTPEPTGLTARLRRLSKQYGWVAVGVYFGLSVIDFPFCFLAVRLAGPERIGKLEHAILGWLTTTFAPAWRVLQPAAEPVWNAIEPAVEWVLGIFRTRPQAVELSGAAIEEAAVKAENKKRAGASIWTELAIAYGIHKTLLIFVRVPLAAALTPKVARVLQSYGWKVGKAKVA